MKIRTLAVVPILAIAASAAITSSPPAAVADVTTAAWSPTTTMYAVTANIGRSYKYASAVRDAMVRIRNNSWDVANGRPRYIGWQEIDEGDPANEMGILKDVYSRSRDWHRKLYRRKSSGELTKLKVPSVAKSAQRTIAWVKYGADGLKNASPTRWITVMRFDNQNITFINTHFMASAWSTCNDRCSERKKRWRQLWRNLKAVVANQHDAGANVILTGDFNRKLGEAYPGWTPAWIHPDGRRVKSGRVDHIVAVPRAGWKVNKVRRANGSFKQGTWNIGIDGHKAHWVAIRFLRK